MKIEAKPTVAFILSLIGSIFLFLGAVIFLLLSPPLGAVGVVVAIMVLLPSVMLYYRTQESSTWSIIIIVFAAIAFGPWNFFGGFIVGSTLAIVGGALGLSFKPTPSAPVAWMAYPGTPYAWGPPAMVTPYGPYPWGWPWGSPPRAEAAPPASSEAAATVQGAAQVSPRFCTQCGAPAFPGAAYCGVCGAKLGWGTPAPAKSG